jgi:hypothetical protein
VTISSARIAMGFRAEQTRTFTLSSASASGVVNWDDTFSFTDGTGANQASIVYSATRTLAASAAESLDLVGALTDAFGNTFNADRMKAIKITAASGNTNTVNVTRPASNGVPFFLSAGDGIGLTPGAGFMGVWPDANGINVTASTGDLITFTNSAGSTSVTYSIAILCTE